jgi:hypothetical protein
MGERRNGYKPEGTRPLGRCRCGWEKNIKMDLERWDGVALTGLKWLGIGTSGGLL